MWYGGGCGVVAVMWYGGGCGVVAATWWCCDGSRVVLWWLIETVELIF